MSVKKKSRVGYIRKRAGRTFMLKFCSFRDNTMAVYVYKRESASQISLSFITDCFHHIYMA